MVCYTGIAKCRLPGGWHDTVAWLQKALSHPMNERRTPQPPPHPSRDEGSSWLGKIPAKYKKLTLTMIAYDQKDKPRVYVISNFERPGQPELPTPANELFRTPVRPRGEPRCIVTGWASSVSEAEKAALTELLSRKPSAMQLCDEIAFTNREASAKNALIAAYSGVNYGSHAIQNTSRVSLNELLQALLHVSLESMRTARRIASVFDTRYLISRQPHDHRLMNGPIIR